MRQSIAAAYLAGMACCLASGTALAQGVTKPGLWEVTSKMSSPTNPQLTKQMEEAQKAMASMPPAQRKQMEEMMTKQGMGMSMSMSFGADGAMAMKLCITPEMANRPPVQQQSNCTYKNSQSGSTHNISYLCANPPSDGEGQIVFSNAENYTGKMRINTAKDGRKETIDMQTSGKFVGANCGAIKPLPMAGK